MKQLFILLVINICVCKIAIAQKEFNNWFFGNRSALNFSTGLPVFVPGSNLVSQEGCSSISDKQGNLLFYSNGVNVWTKNHTLMPNGTGLNGDVSSTQSVLITNHPGNTNLYYIFTTPKEGGTNALGLQYSVVNMSLNGGLGDIDVTLGKNIDFNLRICEKVTAIKHRNGNDIWLITRRFESTQFVEYLIDCSGLIAFPQGFYNAASNIDRPDNAGGYLKGSPDGKRLVAANFHGDIDLFDFDNTNGVISNARVIYSNPSFTCGPYGVEFSPDSKLLYTSEINDCNTPNTYNIFQYQLEAGDIPASKLIIDAGTANPAGALQLGPDNKVYVAYDQASYLGAITNANVPGPGSTLVKQYVNLPAPALSGLGLPNVATGFTGYNKSLLGDDTVLCDEPSLTLRLNIPNTDILWGDGTTLDSLVITATGTYTVRITHGSCVYRDTVKVTLQPSSQFSLGNDTAICLNKFPYLLKGTIPGATYLWQDGSTNATFPASKDGLYWLQVSVNGCITRDSINIAPNPVPQFSLGADTSVCASANLTLTANVPATSYLWSTGNNSQSIVATTSGIYWCDATNSAGCSYRDSIKVTVSPAPLVNLGKDTVLCQNKFPLLLSQSIAGATYLWQDGTTNPSFSAPGAGTYWLEATVNGCAARDSIIVSANTADVFSLGADSIICGTQPLTLTVIPTFTKYLWSNGSSAKSINVNATGIYWCEATNSFGCSYRDSILITYRSAPVVNLGKDTALCLNKFPLKLSQAITGATYLWQDGSTASSFSAPAGGIYWVEATVNGCSVRDSIAVSENTVDVFSLGADSVICGTQPVTLTVIPAMTKYLWSNGSSAKSINVNVSGLYWCEATNSSGCSYRDSIQLTFKPAPVVNLGKDTALCQDKFPLKLSQSITGATYLWQDGSTASSLSAIAAGVYWLQATVNGCSVRDSITITASIVDAFSLGADSVICGTKPLSLTVIPAFTKYLWSNGSTAKSINVTASGIYWCEATNSSGCSYRDSIQLTFRPSPVVNIGKDTALCQNKFPLNLSQSISGATYLWQDGSTNASFSAITGGVYWLEASVNGCSTRDSILITANPVDVFNLGADSIICGTQPLTLTVIPAFAKYLWSNGATSKSITINSTGLYWCEATNSSGCSFRDTINLAFNPSSIVNLGKDTILCQDKLPVLIGQNISNASFLWQDGTTNAFYSVSTPGLYWVQATINGCSTRDSINIAVSTATAFTLGADTASCVNQPVTLGTSQAFTKYLWSTGSTTSNITVNTAGNFWLEATNNSGCSYRDTIGVSFKPLPVVNLGKDTTVCQASLPLVIGQNIAGATYLWQDGSTNASYAVTAPGTYWMQATVNGCSSRDSIKISTVSATGFSLGADTVLCSSPSLLLGLNTNFNTYLWSTGSTNKNITVTASGDYWLEAAIGAGCSYRDTIKVTFVSGPVVNLGNDTTICQANLPFVIGQNIAGATYLWQDGSTNASYSVNVPGVYWLQVTANGCTSRDSIKIASLGATGFSLGTDTLICSSPSLLLGVNTNFSAYLWSTGSTNKNITVTTSGEYWLEASSGAGCSYRDTIKVTFGAGPVVNLGKDTTICQSALPLQIGQAIAGATYLWQNGSTSAFISVSASGLYWMQATVGGCTSRDSIMVSVVNASTFSLGKDTVICNTQPLVLGVAGSFSNYLWSNGSTNKTITVNASGDYWLQASLSAGCSYRDTIHVDFNSPPSFSLGRDTTVCNSSSYLLNVSGAGDSYLWQDNSTQPQFLVNKNGSYHVLINKGGCSSTDTVTVMFKSKPAPDLGADNVICPGGELILNPSVAGTTFTWQDGSKGLTYRVVAPGRYTVAVANECGTGNDEVVISRGACELLVPNAFTPGKRTNNIFRLPNAFGLNDFKLQVFNRWGQQVFQTTNSAEGWDGRYKGLEQSTGMYIYIISYKDATGDMVTQKGTVILVR